MGLPGIADLPNAMSSGLVKKLLGMVPVGTTWAFANVKLADTSSDHYVQVACAGNETANRALSVPVLGADMNVAVSGLDNAFSVAQTFIASGIKLKDATTGNAHILAVANNAASGAQTYTFPAAGASGKTLAVTGLDNAFSVAQTFIASGILLKDATTGNSHILAIANNGASGAQTFTFPAPGASGKTLAVTGLDNAFSVAQTFIASGILLKDATTGNAHILAVANNGASGAQTFTLPAPGAAGQTIAVLGLAQQFNATQTFSDAAGTGLGKLTHVFNTGLYLGEGLTLAPSGRLYGTTLTLTPSGTAGDHSGDGTYVTFKVGSTAGLQPGMVVVVAGFTPTGWNGTARVYDVPSATTFRIANATAAGPGTVVGTLTHGARVALGALGVTPTASTDVMVGASGAAVIPLTIMHAATPTTNFVSCKGSTGTELGGVASTGELKSAVGLSTYAGQAITVAATVPTQADAAQAGVNATFRASDAIAGSVTVGAANGGNFYIYAGDAKRLTSGNGNAGITGIYYGSAIGSGTTGYCDIGLSTSAALRVGNDANNTTVPNGCRIGGTMAYAWANDAKASGMPTLAWVGDAVTNFCVYLRGGNIGGTSNIAAGSLVLYPKGLITGYAVANPTAHATLSNHTSDGTLVTIKTSATHNLTPGQVVTLAGWTWADGGGNINVTALVNTTPTTTTFTVNPATWGGTCPTTGTNPSVVGTITVNAVLQLGAAPTDSKISTDSVLCGSDLNMLGKWVRKQAGDVVTTADFTKNNTTTLANITGLSVTLTAGRTYRFEATLFTTADTDGGVKVAMSGTATATAIKYDVLIIDGAVIDAQGRGTALDTAVGFTDSANALIKIYGTIVVNVGGTLTVQFAQNAAHVGDCTVLAQSTLSVREI